MKFAVMTGGGDCPGMNAFIRAVVRTALNTRPQTSVWGVLDGWRGLMENRYRRLGKLDVAGISSAGGTILGTVRFPELAHDTDLQETIARNLDDAGFDYLFVCGGNGSLNAGAIIDTLLRREELRTRILVCPGSIDNDVCNMYGSSIGFYSAIDKSLEMLEWIRDTASAHRRVYLIRSMGRNSAFLPLFAGIASGAEYVIRPREHVDFEKMATMISERDRDSRIIVSEAFPKSLDEIQAILENIFERRDVKREIRSVDMSYFQRGGTAATTDILRASWLGYQMVKDAFDKCDSGYYTAFYTGQKITPIPLSIAADDTQTSHADIPPEFIEFALALR
jgi:6-phosphofructokinase 1